MAFGDRYRQRTEEKKVEEKPVLKIVEEKTFTSGDGFTSEEFIPIEETEPKIKIVRKNRPRKSKPIPKDIIKDLPPIVEKNGVENKKYVNIALNGTTIECVDFRAIVKKKGLKITEVLTKIIKQWNADNYNF